MSQVWDLAEYFKWKPNITTGMELCFSTSPLSFTYVVLFANNVRLPPKQTLFLLQTLFNHLLIQSFICSIHFY